jgi:ABC-type glycerol-3-phosphate transport system substrate-binding protein
MHAPHFTRRQFLGGLASTSAALGLSATAASAAAPAVKKGTSLRLWILKTYVEPTNKAIEASAQRWAQKHGAAVTVEYFTFEDMQTRYVAAIENKSTPDVGQLETGAPARFAGMGQLLDLSTFTRQIEGEVGKPSANVAPVTVIDSKVYAIPWYIMAAFWYVWRDVFEKSKVKLPETFEDARKAAQALNRPAENFYGMGQSWNRTADGYGVMQSLMYSHGVGWARKDGKYQSLKSPPMQQVMRWATDIYKEGIQPPDTLSWTGSQNNENFIAKKIAQTSNGPSITFALENALAKATDAKDRKLREEALANHVALPHLAGPDGRRMWAIAMSLAIFRGSKDPDAAMSLVAHLLSPEETLSVMKDSYGQFAPVLDKARAASREYFNKNDNYRTFGRASEWFVGTGWPGPVTAAAAEVQASNVLTDAPAKVIVDKWSTDQAIDWQDKKIKDIYDTLGST